MYQTYRDRAGFLFVYVREAHPSDEWQMPGNEKEGVVFAQPKTSEARHDVARQCCSKLSMTMPCVVDTIDNHVDELYAAWPERIYIVGKDGHIACAGGQGPFGFKPEEAEAWLKKYVH
jgi:hypothetical protein